MRRILFLLFIFALISPSVLSIGENEYLFEGETVSKVFDVSINDNNYYVYGVTQNNVIDLTGQNNKELIVIGPSNYVAEDEKVKESFFVYYTFNYFTENDENIERDYQKAGNYIEKNANSLGQNILDLFKEIPELCKEIPKLEIIKICVKPSTELDIINVANKKIPDWTVALDNFDKLGGKILRLTGPEKTALFENANNIHKYLLTSEEFLKNMGLIEQYSSLKTQPLRDFVGSNSNEQFVKLSDRITKLKTAEEVKKEELDNLLENITSNIKEIAKLNGNFSNFNSERRLILKDRSEISFNDNYYTSDINLLNKNIATATELKNSTSLSFSTTQEIHTKRNILSKGFNRFIGFFRVWWV